MAQANMVGRGRRVIHTLPPELQELATALPLTLSKAELCDLLKLARSTVDRAIELKEIRYVKARPGKAGRVIFPRSEVLRWMSERMR